MATYRFSMDQKLRIIKMCEDGADSIKSITPLFELSVTPLNSWRTKYHMGEFSTLHNRTKWTRYPEELRTKAIRAVLTKEESLSSATLRFNISSTSVLAIWIRKYTSHNTHGKQLKERSIMTKDRITTFKERVYAFINCIQKSGKNYQRILETHRVSYQQIYKIYNWVRKFDKGGIVADIRSL